jgi:hypothetical protein
LSVWAQLPEADRVKVADFARYLLARNGGAAPRGATERWLAGARGVAKPGVTTAEVMAWTRVIAP